MIKFKTKKMLIKNWIKVYPDDKDFKFNAVAGHVRLKNGFYVNWDEFICIRNNRRKKK